LLKPEERKKAPLIYKSLMKAKLAFDNTSYEDLKKMITNDINDINGMELDYIEIVNPNSFKPLKNKSDSKDAIALISVFLGNVRLIDNLSLND
jgi:pantoate--beta-alanine ligase